MTPRRKSGALASMPIRGECEAIALITTPDFMPRSCCKSGERPPEALSHRIAARRTARAGPRLQGVRLPRTRNDGRRKVAGWVPGLLVFGALTVLSIAERRRPLRPSVEPRNRRDARNLGVAATTAMVLRLTEKPLITALGKYVERRRWGLLPRLGLPRSVEAVL